MLREEIKAISSSRRDLRNFGFVVGGGFIILSALLLWKEKSLGPYVGGAGLLLIVLGPTLPELLKPLQKTWMTLAILMGWFMTRLILCLLFYLVLTPIGLVARLAGKRFLESPTVDPESCWIRRAETGKDERRLEKQF